MLRVIGMRGGMCAPDGLLVGGQRCELGRGPPVVRVAVSVAAVLGEADPFLPRHRLDVGNEAGERQALAEHEDIQATKKTALVLREVRQRIRPA